MRIKEHLEAAREGFGLPIMILFCLVLNLKAQFRPRLDTSVPLQQG